jgi:hypothetical protein
MELLHCHSVLQLVERVDRAYHDVYDKPSLSYQLKIWKPILPVVGLILILLLATIVDMYLIPLSTAERISTSLNIMALAVALFALIIAMVSVAKPQMRKTEESEILSKIEGLDKSDLPVVKGLIRMRVRSLSTDLHEIYESDPSVFERAAILKRLIE